MKPFPIAVVGRGFHKGGYAGAFSPSIERIIRSIVDSPCLHLFSGASVIGDERVDLNHANATIHQDVFDFIAHDKRHWEFCILDPPYAIKSKHKLHQYADRCAVSCSVPKRRALEKFFRERVNNIIWLDQCAPLPKGFDRVKCWTVFPGGYRTVRVLSWLRAVQVSMTSAPPIHLPRQHIFFGVAPSHASTSRN